MILFKKNCTDFWDKLKLQYICKKVKDSITPFLPDISFANVCTKKKIRGLYHVFERRYLKLSSPTFLLKILVIPTALSVQLNGQSRDVFYTVFLHQSAPSGLLEVP